MLPWFIALGSNLYNLLQYLKDNLFSADELQRSEFDHEIIYDSGSWGFAEDEVSVDKFGLIECIEDANIFSLSNQEFLYLDVKIS